MKTSDKPSVPFPNLPWVMDLVELSLTLGQSNQIAAATIFSIAMDMMGLDKPMERDEATRQWSDAVVRVACEDGDPMGLTLRLLLWARDNTRPVVLN